MTPLNNAKATPFPSLPDSWQPQIAGPMTAQRVGAELILLDRRGQKVHQLDAVGTRILDLCDGQHGLQDIAAQLLTEFDVGDDELRNDTLDFLCRLRAAGIVR